MMNSEGIETRGRWFAVRRPNGRRSAWIFGSPFRAAEHAMRSYRVPTWTYLRDRGFRVIALSDPA